MIQIILFSYYSSSTFKIISTFKRDESYRFKDICHPDQLSMFIPMKL